MKHLLLTTIAGVLLVGCATTQQSAPAPEAKPVELIAIHPDDVQFWGRDSIHHTAFDGRIEAVKQHLAAGTDVNAKSDDGGTPLHYAAGGGHEEIVELLIAEGADVNAKDEIDGWTALHIVVSTRHKELVELLIAKGADVNAKKEAGKFKDQTSLDRAINLKHNETADLLRKHGGKTGEELKAEGN